MDKDKDKMAGIPAADERDPKPVDVDKVNSDALAAEDSGKVSGGQPGTEGMRTREGKKPRMSRREKRLSKKAEREQILRIRELEELMSQTGGDVDQHVRPPQTQKTYRCGTAANGQMETHFAWTSFGCVCSLHSSIHAGKDGQFHHQPEPT